MSDHLRPAEATMGHRVALALDTVPAHEGDAAVRRLAMLYAEAIDDADEEDSLFRFGPKLQATLDSLGLTPRARAALPLKAAGSGRLAEARAS